MVVTPFIYNGCRGTNAFFGHPVVLFQGRFLHIILLLFWLVAIYFEQPEFSFQP